MLERRLVQRVHEHGGIALKFTSPGMAGLPDRIILLPEGKIIFVEVKQPGEKPRILQATWHKKLRQLGFKVFVIHDASQIEEVMPYEVHSL